MAVSWEDKFSSWSNPPGATEQSKCDNAVRAIRSAVDASINLSIRDISVFAQGSYRNRTNIRMESDADICILCTNTYYYDLPENLTSNDLGISPATYTYETYKQHVKAALESHFGSYAVNTGNKAFDIHQNTYRVDADAIACFEYRKYHRDGNYYEGTAFVSNGLRVVNWPQQNYDNGVEKNDATGRRFKAVVRILKQLRNEMKDSNISVADSIPSYLLECLVFNVPNEGFGQNTLTGDVRWVLAHLWNNTRKLDDCVGWNEINGIKRLFDIFQPWNLEQTHLFLDTAWNYVGFE